MPSSGRITAGELTRVCSQYDLGEVKSARRLKGGSGQAPKILLQTSTGAYLLKRRAPGRDDPATVAIGHEVQIFLAQNAFPTAPLLGTRRGNNSMLQLDGRVYEVFRFVDGVRFDRSSAHAAEAGKTLARLHVLLSRMTPAWQPVVGAYHAAAGVIQRLSAIPGTLGDPLSRETTRALKDMYRRCAAEAEHHAADWRPEQLIHADWHPGNMIFSNDNEAPRVLAVLDFDSVRQAPPVVDLANAALQFSILRGVQSAGTTKQNPDEFDLTRFEALCHGYHLEYGQPLRAGEIQALPALMVEALVTEAAVTIAATGRFGPVGGWEMLQLVLRKGQWIEEHAATMIDAARRAK